MRISKEATPILIAVGVEPKPPCNILSEKYGPPFLLVGLRRRNPDRPNKGPDCRGRFRTGVSDVAVAEVIIISSILTAKNVFPPNAK